MSDASKQRVWELITAKLWRRDKARSDAPVTVKVVVALGKIEIISTDNKFSPIHVKPSDIRERPKVSMRSSTECNLDFVQDADVEYKSINFQVYDRTAMEIFVNTLSFAWEPLKIAAAWAPPKARVRDEDAFYLPIVSPYRSFLQTTSQSSEMQRIFDPETSAAHAPVTNNANDFRKTTTDRIMEMRHYIDDSSEEEEEEEPESNPPSNEQQKENVSVDSSMPMETDDIMSLACALMGNSIGDDSKPVLSEPHNSASSQSKAKKIPWHRMVSSLSTSDSLGNISNQNPTLDDAPATKRPRLESTVETEFHRTRRFD
ncbi:hypothetical protein PFISCL1PPCAC_10906 [Pristionchus fissidentatus]|uniref:Uncharacterized protein n=1 Tax=Pristionchus fissidentatus TaxID=1538716 RepID=A0AAV5VJ94_9BILA|nr:hypothetical protein PFISCL1PPCAC_10906 [Pristionchus fissidentatus]